MDFNRIPITRNPEESDVLQRISRHMYVKHRNIMIGIGLAAFCGLTSFIVLRNYSYKNRDHLSNVRREIQLSTPGTESMFELYHEKLKKRQQAKEQSQNKE